MHKVGTVGLYLLFFFNIFLCNDYEGMDEWKTTLRGAQLNRTPLCLSGEPIYS